MCNDALQAVLRFSNEYGENAYGGSMQTTEQ